MATFPTGVSSLSDPLSSDKMNVVSHSGQHKAANDEIDAIETALGASLANVVTTTQLDTDVALAADSNVKVATQKATKAYVDAAVITGGGIPIGYLDTDTTLSADSDTKVSSQKAVKAYIDATSQLPSGAIILWSGTVANIPTGFVLCNGSNSTPDLRDKFVVGAKQDDGAAAKTNITGSLTQTGGAATKSLSEAELATHRHFCAKAAVNDVGVVDSTHSMGYIKNAGTDWRYDLQNATDAGANVALSSSIGSGTAFSLLNPYYALCYIMKT